MILREAGGWFFLAFILFLWFLEGYGDSEALKKSEIQVDSLKWEITILQKKNDSLSLRLELKK